MTNVSETITVTSMFEVIDIDTMTIGERDTISISELNQSISLGPVIFLADENPIDGGTPLFTRPGVDGGSP